jgi:hypothetical protein
MCIIKINLVVMRKFNSSKSFSNRRAVVTGYNPVVMYDKYKNNMKVLEAHREFENAQYQEKQRYMQTHTEPIPQFTYSMVAQAVKYQSQSSSPHFVSSISPSYKTLLLRSSFKDLFERISTQQESTILKEFPKSSTDWLYATGGVMPYRK